MTGRPKFLIHSGWRLDRGAIRDDGLARKTLLHERNRIAERCVYRSAVIKAGIIVVLNGRARFTSSFDERILICLWVYVVIIRAGADEYWVIEFQCRVCHIGKDRSTQDSGVLSDRISRSKLSRQRGFQYGWIAL